MSALLKRVNLWDHRNKAVSSYSGGMRQRFGIAQALLGDPQLTGAGRRLLERRGQLIISGAVLAMVAPVSRRVCHAKDHGNLSPMRLRMGSFGIDRKSVV